MRFASNMQEVQMPALSSQKTFDQIEQHRNGVAELSKNLALLTETAVSSTEEKVIVKFLEDLPVRKNTRSRLNIILPTNTYASIRRFSIRLKLEHNVNLSNGEVALGHAVHSMASMWRLQPNELMNGRAIKDNFIERLFDRSSLKLLDGLTKKAQPRRVINSEDLQKIENAKEYFDLVVGGKKFSDGTNTEVFSNFDNADSGNVAMLAALFEKTLEEDILKDDASGLEAVTETIKEVVESKDFPPALVKKAVMMFLTNSSIARKYYSVPPLFKRQPGLI